MDTLFLKSIFWLETSFLGWYAIPYECSSDFVGCYDVRKLGTARAAEMTVEYTVVVLSPSAWRVLRKDYERVKEILAEYKEKMDGGRAGRKGLLIRRRRMRSIRSRQNDGMCEANCVVRRKKVRR